MTLWPSPIKINLFLYITGQREDNYHNLQTLFQLVDYGDNLIIEPRLDNEISLENDLANIPKQRNLIWRTAKVLQNYAIANTVHADAFLGAAIRVIKCTPVGAGLGGGSSNAATTLIALNHLWGLNLPVAELTKIGTTVGADVPIFIGGQAAFAEGIGDKLLFLNLPEKYYLIVVPAFSISTPLIFNHPDLKRNSPVRTLDECLNMPFYNDIEPLVRKLYPALDSLMKSVLPFADFRLTGTGSAIFATFDNRAKAEEIKEHLPGGLISIIAKSLAYSPLRKYLLH